MTDGVGDEDYGELRAEPAVQRWFARFDPIHQRLLETLPAPEEPVPSADDSLLIALVDAALARADRSIAEISTKVPRFARYGERLSAAFERVEEGEMHYLSDPDVDSLRSIWVEFHNDVLLTLGRE